MVGELDIHFEVLLEKLSQKNHLAIYRENVRNQIVSALYSLQENGQKTHIVHFEYVMVHSGTHIS